MTEDELQHLKQTVHDLCGVVLRLQIDMQAKDDLRDQFAMAALTAVMNKVGGFNAKIHATDAYEIADAMLKAREAK